MAVSWIASIIGLFYGLPFFSFFLPGSSFVTFLAIANVLVTIGIPLVALVLLVMRIFFRSSIQPRWKAGLWAFWVLNIVSLFVIAPFTAKQFNSGESIQSSASGFTNSDTLSIELAANPYEDVWFYVGDELQIADDQLISNNVCLSIEKSESDEFELVQRQQARGLNSSEASKLAHEIDYHYELSESNLTLPPNFVIPQGGKWRNQKVELVLQVPEGKSIRFGKNARKIISHMEVSKEMNHPWWRYDETGRVWKMEAGGLVSLEDIEGQSSSGESSDSDDNFYHLSDFTKVHVSGKIKVRIDQGNDFKVRVAGKESDTPKVEVIESDKAVEISAAAEPTSPVRVYITMPSLEELNVEGTDDIRLRGFEQKSMRIINKGEGNIKAYVDVENLEVQQNGGNELDIRGQGNYLKATLDKKALLDAKRYAVNVADIVALHSNRIKLAVTDTLRQQLGEGSRIVTDGEPLVISLPQQ